MSQESLASRMRQPLDTLIGIFTLDVVVLLVAGSYRLSLPFVSLAASYMARPFVILLALVAVRLALTAAVEKSLRAPVARGLGYGTPAIIAVFV